MFEEVLYTFLLSLSPFGEARAGIPYGVLNDVPLWAAFLVGFFGNFIIYPIFSWMIHKFSKKLWTLKLYRRVVVSFCKRAKKGIGSYKEKYGFWALMIFVMVPLPGSGVYMGTIAANLFKISKRQAFVAISLGALLSCVLVTGFAYFGNEGLKLVSMMRK